MGNTSVTWTSKLRPQMADLCLSFILLIAVLLGAVLEVLLLTRNNVTVSVSIAQLIKQMPRVSMVPGSNPGGCTPQYEPSRTLNRAQYFMVFYFSSLVFHVSIADLCKLYILPNAILLCYKLFH